MKEIFDFIEKVKSYNDNQNIKDYYIMGTKENIDFISNFVTNMKPIDVEEDVINKDQILIIPTKETKPVKIVYKKSEI